MSLLIKAGKVAGSIVIKDAKVAHYVAKYHTDELVKKILSVYGDLLKNDDEKKEEIKQYAAAVALRNFKKSSLKSIKVAATGHTFDLVEKIKKLHDNPLMSSDEKKKEISRCCLAIALRNGAADVKNSVLTG